jgi:hypothetical protein
MNLAKVSSVKAVLFLHAYVNLLLCVCVCEAKPYDISKIKNL